jgi:hypothetical protein
MPDTAEVAGRAETVTKLYVRTQVVRRGKGNEVQEDVEAENKKDHARQISRD